MYGVCRHCVRNISSRVGRGLCRCCWNHDEIREMYPLLAPFGGVEASAIARRGRPMASPQAPAKSKAENWAEVPEVIDARPAEQKMTLYGIGRGFEGRRVDFDCGGGPDPVAVVTLTFRDAELAREAVNKGCRFDIKIVADPEETCLP